MAEHLASDRWQINAWSRCASSGHYTCRVLAAYKGTLKHVVASTLLRLLDPCSWLPVTLLGRSVSNACLAFAVLYATECALEQLMLRQLRGYPWKLFRLITADRDAEVEHLMNTAWCLLDEFTKAFFAAFWYQGVSAEQQVQSMLGVNGCVPPLRDLPY